MHEHVHVDVHVRIRRHSGYQTVGVQWRGMRHALVVCVGLAATLAGTACTPEVWLAPDLQHASGRAARQTASAQIALLATDVDQPYDVLGDLEVSVRQRGAFGDPPTRAHAEQAMREQAGRMGAHAVILVAYGQIGSSWWSYVELRGHGRAIRFR